MNPQTVTAAPLQSAIKKDTSYRVESIDLLRGLIMIIMALDHVRDYFHYGALVYDPTDLTRTSTAVFFTRWITHFCAPVFMLLSGTSAFLVGQRKGKKALAKFLLTRGLWLILLEFTIIKFGWSFNISYSSLALIVIWALGISMIALAALIYLPIPWILGIGLLMVFGHNWLDTLPIPDHVVNTLGWRILHQPGFFPVGDVNLFIAYPVIPWIGVMALGYCLGKLYQKDFPAAKRKKWLINMGLAAIVLFIVLRYTNTYGNPFDWTQQKTAWFTVLSFLNLTKYPPSLLYLLMTLGPSLLFLAFTEKSRSWIAEKIKVIGRVPMFYYILHIYLLHFVAMFATYLTGHKPADMTFDSFIFLATNLQGYGFSLAVTYLVWFGLVVILYFMCKWYDRYKQTHHHWWLSYL
jgi:uncharacterized membrane protein